MTRNIMLLGRATLSLLVVLGAQAQTRQPKTPTFAEYAVPEIFSGSPAAPKVSSPWVRLFADEIVNGVRQGYGVFREGKEQAGPNFAGHLIIIQWGCGAPCLRMAVVNARTGDVYGPPLTYSGRPHSFDLPLLMRRNEVAQNPVVTFRPDSSLVTIEATPASSRQSYMYYFVWNRRWILLKRVPQ
jgi:hypothetical protein